MWYQGCMSSRFSGKNFEEMFSGFWKLTVCTYIIIAVTDIQNVNSCPERSWGYSYTTISLILNILLFNETFVFVWNVAFLYGIGIHINWIGIHINWIGIKILKINLNWVFENIVKLEFIKRNLLCLVYALQPSWKWKGPYHFKSKLI